MQGAQRQQACRRISGYARVVGGSFEEETKQGRVMGKTLVVVYVGNVWSSVEGGAQL